MSALLFVNAEQVATCAGPGRARRGPEAGEIGLRSNVAVAVEAGLVQAIAPYSELRDDWRHAEVVDCTGCVLTPGLVDSHTHALFGANRADEMTLRAHGMSYMAIANSGGGIRSSVRSLRATSEGELEALLRRRLLRFASYGTTTVEIKSGYGLSTESELRSLAVIGRVAEVAPLNVVATWLGAHDFPEEYAGSPHARELYVELLVNEMLPQVVCQGIAQFADIFCEPGVFTVEQSRRILGAARAAGLRLKLHADELQYSGAAELAAELGAISADHLAAISPEGVRALAEAGVIATLLPGTMLFLGLPARAPARAMIEAGCAVALATDFNPGTSPTVNLPLIMTLGCTQLGLTAAECLIAATVNGAAALGLAQQKGQIAPAFHADLALFEGRDINELPYWYGDRLCRGSWAMGKACCQFDLPIT